MHKYYIKISPKFAIGILRGRKFAICVVCLCLKFWFYLTIILKIYHKEVTIFDIKLHSIKDQTPLCTYVPWNSSKTNDNERSKPKKDNLSLTLVFLNLDNGSFQIQYLQRSSSSTCCTVDKKIIIQIIWRGFGVEMFLALWIQTEIALFDKRSPPFAYRVKW